MEAKVLSEAKVYVGITNIIADTLTITSKKHSRYSTVNFTY